MNRESIIIRDIDLLKRRNRVLSVSLKNVFDSYSAEVYDSNRLKILLLSAELKGILGERVRIRDSIVRISNSKISKDKKFLLIDKLFDGDSFE